MTLRKFFFWLHLTAGTVAGIVILIMSVTGVLLMYQKQMTAWADGRHRFAPPSPGTERLPMEMLLARVRETRTAPPSGVTARADPSEAVAVAYGRDIVYVNPYTGEVLGEGSKRIRAFFQFLIDWHRWLGAQGESRPAARAITGACNIAFLFLVMSGFYLWWPRKWSWKHVSSVVTFRSGLTGRARDWNWHNVIGSWSAIPLFFVVSTALFFSYPWANTLLYKVTGSEPPAAPARRPGAAASPRGEWQLDGLSERWARAEQQVPVWQSISLRLPPAGDATVTFAIDESSGAARPDKRSQLTLDLNTGEVVRWEPYASHNLGRQIRLWIRWVHTGEAGGVIGQTVAGVVSAGGAVLVWTGVALAWRRFLAWRQRKRVREEVLV
ncbi:MAG: PepSY-associated TM helix domain-containing protein [Bryobacteraceae bacterium]